MGACGLVEKCMGVDLELQYPPLYSPSPTPLHKKDGNGSLGHIPITLGAACEQIVADGMTRTCLSFTAFWQSVRTKCEQELFIVLPLAAQCLLY